MACHNDELNERLDRVVPKDSGMTIQKDEVPLGRLGHDLRMLYEVYKESQDEVRRLREDLSRNWLKCCGAENIPESVLSEKRDAEAFYDFIAPKFWTLVKERFDGYEVVDVRAGFTVVAKRYHGMVLNKCSLPYPQVVC